MKPAYGGQVPPVRRNLFNIILALDLSKTTSVSSLNLLTSIVQRGYPFRFGVVPIAETEEGTGPPNDTPHDLRLMCDLWL